MKNCPFTLHMGYNRHGLIIPHPPTSTFTFESRLEMMSKLVYAYHSFDNAFQWIMDVSNQLHQDRAQHLNFAHKNHFRISPANYDYRQYTIEHHNRRRSSITVTESRNKLDPDFLFKLEYKEGVGYDLTWELPCGIFENSNAEEWFHKRSFNFKFKMLNERGIKDMVQTITQHMWLDSSKAEKELEAFMRMAKPHPKFNWFKSAHAITRPTIINSDFMDTELITTHVPLRRDVITLRGTYNELSGLRTHFIL
ncbi:hypothetical protein [Vibrio phage pTD1]|uniref:Uncharacterized protein n=1 Tax=Vibrio phage pTD1 TaxID=1938577 RepID=A0A1Q2U316_9CAUD|nr:hypothetical protein FDH33_gp145 [Vibrio phage pTD1]BAW98354.1 hypothetical protein [Vibrio phage pTD1]